MEKLKPHTDGAPIQPGELPAFLPGYLLKVKAEFRADGQFRDGQCFDDRILWMARLQEFMQWQMLFQILAAVGALGMTGKLLKNWSLSDDMRQQLLSIKQRPELSPQMQLEFLGSDNATLDRLEQEWMFVARSFCVNPQKIRLDDSVCLLSKFDSLGGDASIELDAQLNRDKPLDPSCTVRELIFLLDESARRTNHG